MFFFPYRCALTETAESLDRRHEQSPSDEASRPTEPHICVKNKGKPWMTVTGDGGTLRHPSADQMYCFVSLVGWLVKSKML